MSKSYPSITNAIQQEDAAVDYKSIPPCRMCDIDKSANSLMSKTTVGMKTLYYWLKLFKFKIKIPFLYLVKNAEIRSYTCIIFRTISAARCRLNNVDEASI